MALSQNSYAFIGFGTGYSYISYDETHEYQPELEENFIQHGANFRGELKFGILSDIVLLGADFDYLGPSLSSSDPNATVSILDANGRGILVVPADPFNIGIEAGYFYHSLYPSKTSMGYDAMSGIKYSILTEFISKSGKFNLTFQIPVWIEIANRTEYRGYFQINLDNRSERLPPFSMPKGANLRLGYSLTQTEFSGINEVVIEYQTYTLSLGYNW